MAKLAKVENALKIYKDGETVGRMDVSGEVGWDFYGDAWNAAYFNQQLQSLGAVNLIELHINSPGGSVFDGIAMYNALVQHPATIHVYVDGIAASIASVIAMAGDKIFMPSNTAMFIHEPWMYTAGNAEELRKDAEMLDKNKEMIINSYLRHLKGTSDQISSLMAEETWLTAQEVANTFKNVEVMSQQPVTASLDLHNLGAKAKVPKAMQDFLFEEEALEVEKEGIIAKVVKHLNRKGFDKAAKAVQVDLLELKNTEIQQEENDDMKPEEKDAFKAEIIEEVNAGTAVTVKAVLIETGVIPDPANVVDEDAPIAFVGDPNKPEDVKAHQAKLDGVKAAKIMASGDAEAIAEHLASIEKVPAVPAQPSGNFSEDGTRRTEDPAKKQDVTDTENVLLDCLPKG